jgi:hypothetical protein
LYLNFLFLVFNKLERGEEIKCNEIFKQYYK